MPEMTRRKLALAALCGAGALAAGIGARWAWQAASMPDPRIVRAEFLDGDVVEIDGWIVSRSQAAWLAATGTDPESLL